jgi:predicted O-methyltransferase YrrM
LFLWTRVAAEDAHLISIDLPGGGFGDGYVAWRSPVYRSFAMGKQRIELLRGDSHSESTLEKTRMLLGENQVDLLFIDAGHTYDDVKQDFEMYSSLVAPGGLIAFHDVAVHPSSTGCEVHRFWSEIKSQHESGEFIQNTSQGWAGIGYLRWAR